MANEDRDFSSIDAMPDPDTKPTAPAQGDALATAIQTTGTSIGTDDGNAPEAAAADAAAAATAVRNLAANAVTVGDAVRILKAAAAAWRKDAPKKSDFDTAEKELADARKQMADAEEASGDSSAASDRLDKAVLNLQTLQKKRKDADEAFDREHKKAVAKLNSLTRTAHDGDSPIAPGKPATPGTPGGNPAARTSSPAATPGAAKPAATLGAGKPAETPTTTTSSTSGLTPTEAATLVAAAQGQQNQQQPQAQAQQATAQMPTMPQVPQQNQQQNKGTASEEKPLGDKLAEAALGSSPSAVLASLGSGSPSSTTSSPSPTPAAQQAGTTLRPEFKPASLAAAAVQNPVTSGQSATNLTTQSDVAGRPQGTERTAYTDSPKTSTSAAHTDTAQQQGTQQTARPVTGGGMPMSPGIMGAPGGAAPASRQSGDGERERGVASNSDPLGLLHERGDAVDGGTIAQNRDKPAA